MRWKKACNGFTFMALDLCAIFAKTGTLFLVEGLLTLGDMLLLMVTVDRPSTKYQAVVGEL